VVMKNIAFQPQKLEVEVGTIVTWRNQDGFPHTATSGTNRTAYASTVLTLRCSISAISLPL
jgi:plastocyanin